MQKIVIFIPLLTFLYGGYSIVAKDINGTMFLMEDFTSHQKSIQFRMKAEKFFDSGNYVSSLKYLKKSLAITEKILGKTDEYSNTSANIGLLYHALGDYTTSLKYFQDSLKIKKKYLMKMIQTLKYYIGILDITIKL